MDVSVKQLMLVGKLKIEIREKTLSAEPGSVVVKNHYALISPGTELALFTGTHIGFSDPEITWARYPLQPGYASVGTITFIGCDVTGFTIGEQVLHFKPHADQAILTPRKDLIFKIPVGLDSKRALFARFGQIAYTAVAASGKKDGNVLVLGGGIVGNLCAQLFQAKQGRKAIIADIAQSRAALALRCGVDASICTSIRDIEEAIPSLTNGEGVSTVVEATGVPNLVTESLKVVNRLGEVILLGSTRGKVEIDVYKLVHRKAVSLVGAHESRYPLFSTSESLASHNLFGNEVLRMIAGNELKVEEFLTDIVPPARVADAYDLLLNDRDTHLGIIIDWE